MKHFDSSPSKIILLQLLKIIDIFTRKYQNHPDPHGFDRNKDDVGCET